MRHTLNGQIQRSLRPRVYHTFTRVKKRKVKAPKPLNPFDKIRFVLGNLVPTCIDYLLDHFCGLRVLVWRVIMVFVKFRRAVFCPTVSANLQRFL